MKQAGHDLVDRSREAAVEASEPGPVSIDEAVVAGLELDLTHLFGARSATADTAAGAADGDGGDGFLAEMFRDFATSREEPLAGADAAIRYKLGIAYWEVGLIDEAIAEFALAARDENLVLECASMVGLCFLEKGMTETAIQCFENGLDAMHRFEDQGDP